MLRYTGAVALLSVILVGGVARESRASGRQAALLLPMLKILDKANLSGSLEFSGTCDLENLPDFPRLRVPAMTGVSPLQILRDMLRDDPEIQVSQDQDGMVRMIESGVQTDILNLRISHISFAHQSVHGAPAWDAGHEPNDALIRAILAAPEVTAFMKARDIEWPFSGGGVSGNALGQWPADSPHISGSMDNVTLSQALDQVLETFPGIWVYENCPATDRTNRVVYFRFFYLRNIGNGMFVEE